MPCTKYSTQSNSLNPHNNLCDGLLLSLLNKRSDIQMQYLWKINEGNEVYQRQKGKLCLILNFIWWEWNKNISDIPALKKVNSHYPLSSQLIGIMLQPSEGTHGMQRIGLLAE